MANTDQTRLARPAGVACEKYVASAGPRCAYYLDNGACVRPDELMCVEWLKRNAPLPARMPAALSRQEALTHLRALHEQLAARPAGAR